jgi:hypothetical protein
MLSHQESREGETGAEPFSLDSCPNCWKRMMIKCHLALRDSAHNIFSWKDLKKRNLGSARFPASDTQMLVAENPTVVSVHLETATSSFSLLSLTSLVLQDFVWVLQLIKAVRGLVCCCKAIEVMHVCLFPLTHPWVNCCDTGSVHVVSESGLCLQMSDVIMISVE